MSVTARATITIDIACGSSWSDETTIDQIRKQAIQDAHNVLSKMQDASRHQIKIIGDPQIKIVYVDS